MSGSSFSVEIPQDNKAVTEKMGGVKRMYAKIKSDWYREYQSLLIAYSIANW